jgi:hypothetical protein
VWYPVEGANDLFDHRGERIRGEVHLKRERLTHKARSGRASGKSCSSSISDHSSHPDVSM